MRKDLRPIASLLVGVALLLAGHGLQFSLLPLRGAAEGFSSFALGAIGSSYYSGFVGGCLLAPYLIRRAGHIRAFTALVAMAVIVALAYPLASAVPAWLLFRLVYGFCIAGFYLVIESWLNDQASNEKRGLVMSAYVTVNFGAFAAGQLLVTAYPVQEASSFIVAAMLASASIVPVALTRSAQPAPITIVRFRPGALYRAAPVGLVGSLMVGVANGAFWGLGPISAAGNGLNVGEVASFMSAATIAGALAQYPVGRLSDRTDRRIVLLCLLVGAAVVGVLLFLFARAGWLLLTFGFLFGAMALPGYSLAAAHAYDRTRRGEMVQTAATVLLANALGGAAGPMLAAFTMDALGPRALFLFTAAVEALLAAFVFYRTLVMPPAEEKTGFDLAATAPGGAVVTGATPAPSDPSVPMPEADASELRREEMQVAKSHAAQQQAE
jgi:MFS family permease